MLTKIQPLTFRADHTARFYQSKNSNCIFLTEDQNGTPVNESNYSARLKFEPKAEFSEC